MAYPRPESEVGMSMGTVPKPSGALAGGINDLIVCTYDESHLVSRGRYNAHIEECRRVHREKKEDPHLPSAMKVCPFNRSHHVHASVLDKHVELCDGYFKFQTENQKNPPSMEVEYPRYDLIPSNNAVSGALPKFYDANSVQDWYEEDEGVSLDEIKEALPLGDPEEAGIARAAGYAEEQAAYVQAHPCQNGDPPDDESLGSL